MGDGEVFEVRVLELVFFEHGGEFGGGAGNWSLLDGAWEWRKEGKDTYGLIWSDLLGGT